MIKIKCLHYSEQLTSPIKLILLFIILYFQQQQTKKKPFWMERYFLLHSFLKHISFSKTLIGTVLSSMCLIYMTNNLLSRKQEKEKKKAVWYSSSLLPCQADVWICFVFNRNNMDGKNGATVPTYGEQPHISLFYTDLGSVCIHHNLIAEKQYWS